MAPDRGNLTKEAVVQKGLALDTGLCTMCGLCVAVCPTGALSLEQSGADLRIAFGNGCTDCGLCYQVCPGNGVPLKDLDRYLFGRERDLKTEVLGITRACYQAHAADSEIRATGASGGVATALLVYALETRQISGALVVAFDKERPWQAKGALVTTRREIIEAASSKYVIVPVNAALAGAAAKDVSGPLGCVGVPCHVHGLRKLQYRYPRHFLSKKTAFLIGIHCFAARPMSAHERALKEQAGVSSLDEIKSLCYRRGKGINAQAEITKTSREVVRLGKYVWSSPRHLISGRCMLCWDWGAELADVSVGDFFGPAVPGSEVHLGASTLVVRTETGERLVGQAAKAGYLQVYPTPVEPVLRSAGLMSKKFGRATTLMALRKFGWARPDYQYDIEPMEPLDKTSLASGASVEERERFWAERGIRPLA